MVLACSPTSTVSCGCTDGLEMGIDMTSQVAACIAPATQICTSSSTTQCLVNEIDRVSNGIVCKPAFATEEECKAGSALKGSDGVLTMHSCAKNPSDNKYYTISSTSTSSTPSTSTSSTPSTSTSFTVNIPNTCNCADQYGTFAKLAYGDESKGCGTTNENGETRTCFGDNASLTVDCEWTLVNSDWRQCALQNVYDFTSPNHINTSKFDEIYTKTDTTCPKETKSWGSSQLNCGEKFDGGICFEEVCYAPKVPNTCNCADQDGTKAKQMYGSESKGCGTTNSEGEVRTCNDYYLVDCEPKSTTQGACWASNMYDSSGQLDTSLVSQFYEKVGEKLCYLYPGSIEFEDSCWMQTKFTTQAECETTSFNEYTALNYVCSESDGLWVREAGLETLKLTFQTGTDSYETGSCYLLNHSLDSFQIPENTFLLASYCDDNASYYTGTKISYEDIPNTCNCRDPTGVLTTFAYGENSEGCGYTPLGAGYSQSSCGDNQYDCKSMWGDTCLPMDAYDLQGKISSPGLEKYAKEWNDGGNCQGSQDFTDCYGTDDGQTCFQNKCWIRN